MKTTLNPFHIIYLSANEIRHGNLIVDYLQTLILPTRYGYRQNKDRTCNDK